MPALRVWRHALRPMVALVVAAVGPLAAQNRDTGARGVGGFTSRFIPADVLARMRDRPEGSLDAATLHGPPDSVWVALRAALDSLAIPIGFEDRAAGEIGQQRVRLFRKLGKQPLSSYLRCGDGMTGPNADTYVVYLSFVAFVRPVGAGRVLVAPLLTAQAVDLPNGRNDVINCATTGRLETRLMERLQARFPAPPT